MADGLDPFKYVVLRGDQRHMPGEKHAGCRYFVLDLTHDRFAIPAIRAYADAVRLEQPQLAADLDALIPDLMARFDFDAAAELSDPITDPKEPQ